MPLINGINIGGDLDIVCIIRHGSHLYGLDTPESDEDFKGVYIPKTEHLALGIDKASISFSTGDDESKNTKDDVDIVLYSLETFINMLIEGDTIAIDMIHCNNENLIETSDLWENIVDIRSMFYTKRTKAFMGYVRKQAHKYGIRGSRINTLKTIISVLENYKNDRLAVPVAQLSTIFENTEFVELHLNDNPKKSLILVAGSKYFLSTPVKSVIESLEKKLESYGKRAEEAAENNGVDWKAVSHAIRAGYQLEEIFTTGDLKYPLVNREYLLSVKLGERDFTTEVAEELDRITEKVNTLVKESNYPEFVNTEAVYTRLTDLLERHL